MPVEFGRIYFDTEPLKQSGWPRVSTALENMFKLARLFTVELCIPQAVLDEREAQWLRELDEKLNPLKSAHSDVFRYCRGLCDVPGLELPEVERAGAGYEAQVQQTLKEYEISTPALTERPVEELFRLALQVVPPFAEKGSGFRDAVILSSIIDHLTAHPLKKVAMLVTKDKDFGERAVEALGSHVAGRLKACRSVDELSVAFNSALEQIAQQKWEHDRDRAKAALHEKTEAIAAFVASTIPFREFEAGYFARVVGIRGLQVRLIRDIKTPPPWQRSNSEKLTFSCLVEVGLEAVYEWRPPLPERTMKVGESVDETARILDMFQLPQQGVREIVRIVELECQAVVEHGEYRELQFVNARRRDDLFSEFELRQTLADAWAKRSMEREGQADPDG